MYHTLRRRYDFQRTRRFLLGSSLVKPFEKQLLKRVSLQVHRWDRMYQRGRALDYLTAGLSAVKCIQSALVAAGRDQSPRDVLDFPCGFGRVLRFLKVLFPDARITGVELNATALGFCRDTFGVDVVQSTTEISDLSLDQRFDLIWCGSLLTHVSEEKTIKLLQFFHSHLSDSGVCVFTTHGQNQVEQLAQGKLTLGLDPAGRRRVLDEFSAHGYGYADYPNSPGYGISLASRAHMAGLAENTGDWREAAFMENGWHSFQDVLVYVRGGRPNAF